MTGGDLALGPVARVGILRSVTGRIVQPFETVALFVNAKPR